MLLNFVLSLMTFSLIATVTKSFLCTAKRNRNHNFKMALIEKFKTSDLLKDTPLNQNDLTVIFTASKDGWSSETFHKKVDFNPPLPTVTVCKTKSGVICGAYNPLGWQSRDDYRDSIRAFLFQLDKDGNIQKSKKIIGGPAIYDFGDRALWFAEGLYAPLNIKYESVRRARSILGSAYSTLPNGDRSIFGTVVETEFTEMECYVSKSMLTSSKAMYTNDKQNTITNTNNPQVKTINFMTSLERFLFGDDQQ